MKRCLVSAGVLAIAFLLTVDVPLLAEDVDGDGLEAGLEVVLGLLDTNSNCDGDGWTDFEEVFVYGTDPNLADSDGDGLIDGVNDPDPLDGGTDVGGRSTPTTGLTRNLTESAVTGTTPVEGLWVNALTGQLEVPIYEIDFGQGYRERNVLRLYYLSGITLNGRFGRNIVTNWDGRVSETQTYADVYWLKWKFRFTKDDEDFIRPAACPFTLVKDTINGEWVLTAMRGGSQWFFSTTSGRQIRMADRFGNATTITHGPSGEILEVQFPEGNTVTLTTWATGRYCHIIDWADRAWELRYNCFDELAAAQNPLLETWQFFYLNGSATPNLNANLVRILNPAGPEVAAIEYDEVDRVSKVTTCGGDATFAYTSTSTTVTDFAGNERTWTKTAGAVVPNSLVQSSNRDVRAGDPASWTTTFAHTGDLLRSKIVLPEGNRIDFDWSDFCLVEKRVKATDTDTDSNENDLVWTMTYGSTYRQLDQVTDPMGRTVDRTFDGLEFVTQITYPTITHTDPDVTITESFARNGNGQLTEATDGEGVVTRYEYYATGNKVGLLSTKTVDYGSGKLNLVHSFNYGATRYLTSYTDPDGNGRTFTRDDVGRALTEAAGGYTTQYDWTTAGTLLEKRVANVDETMTQSLGNPWWSTIYDHDPLGRLVSFEEEIEGEWATTRTTTVDYDGNGNVVQINLPRGNVVRNVWDERGLLAERTRGYGSPVAATEEWSYDGNQNLVAYTNGREKVATKAYDDFDRLVRETTPLGNYVSYVLDKNGNVTEVKGYDDEDTLLAHTKQYYDEVNRQWKSERWLDNPAPTADAWLATEYTLDRRGLVTAVTDPLAHSTYFEFDNAGRKSAWEDHLGNRVEYSYADDFLVATGITEVQLKPEGGTESFVTEVVTDALHRVTERRVVDRDNGANKHVFKTKYSSLHVAVEEEDAEGNKTYREHDGLGRIVRVTRDMGGAGDIDTYFAFDLNGNQVGMTDDNGSETTWEFSARDLPTHITYEDTSCREFFYNGDDTLAGWTDENGTEVTNGYDDDGRLTGRAIDPAANVLGPTSEAYIYDGLGRLTEAKNNNSTVQFGYDTLSRLVTETQGPNPIGANGKTISYTWDDAGSRAEVEYFSGFDLSYTVDAVGRWTKITDGSSNDLVTWTYYGPGRRTKQAAYLNGTTENLAYDGFRFVTDIDHKDSSASVFAGFDYAYDRMGNPVYEERTHDGGKGDLYRYDKAYRLTAALIGSDDPSAEAADTDWLDYAYQKRIDYNMDGVSNRSSVVETPYGQGGTTTSYTSNSVNWYTVVGGVSRDHDANGNLTSDGVRDFFYDYRNNLVKVEQDSSVVAEYEFDALGRRTKKTVGAAVTKFFHDGEHCVQEFSGANALLRTFVYGQEIDEIRVMIAPDVADVDGDQDTSEVLNFYYHHKSLGTVSHITGPDEAVVEQYDYSPYGQTTIRDGQGADLSGQSAIENPYMFTARRFDEETGLYHYRRRAYEPETGRFLQRDPLGYADGPSLYSYVRSTPTSRSDPFGLKSNMPKKPKSGSVVSGTREELIGTKQEDGSWSHGYVDDLVANGVLTADEARQVRETLSKGAAGTAVARISARATKAERVDGGGQDLLVTYTYAVSYSLIFVVLKPGDKKPDPGVVDHESGHVEIAEGVVDGAGTTTVTEPQEGSKERKKRQSEIEQGKSPPKTDEDNPPDEVHKKLRELEDDKTRRDGKYDEHTGGTGSKKDLTPEQKGEVGLK